MNTRTLSLAHTRRTLEHTSQMGWLDSQRRSNHDSEWNSISNIPRFSRQTAFCGAYRMQSPWGWGLRPRLNKKRNIFKIPLQQQVQNKKTSQLERCITEQMDFGETLVNMWNPLAYLKTKMSARDFIHLEMDARAFSSTTSRAETHMLLRFVYENWELN